MSDRLDSFFVGVVHRSFPVEIDQHLQSKLVVEVIFVFRDILVSGCERLSARLVESRQLRRQQP